MKFRERPNIPIISDLLKEVFSGPIKNPLVPVLEKKSKPGLRLWTRLENHFLVIRSRRNKSHAPNIRRAADLITKVLMSES